MNDASGAAPPLKTESLAKHFRQGDALIEALKDVSLTVQRGEFVAVMGPSGSGKSTLLHVMAGLTRPARGRILVEGSDLSTMSDRQLTLFRRRRIGLVFQAFNLIPTLTAQDNILLPALVEGHDRHATGAKLDELLTRLDLTGRRRHRPDAMSGGEQQRVAIARAMICDPAIILVDEPTGNLDSHTGQGICRLLKELCEEQGRTIVVVTHEPAVAAWAERIVILKDGRTLAEFPADAFRDAHSLAVLYQDVIDASSNVAAEVHG